MRLTRFAVGGDEGKGEMVRKALLAAMLTCVAATVAIVLSGAASSGRGNGSVIAGAATGQLKPAKLQAGSATRTLPFISDASLVAAQQALCASSTVANCDERAQAADAGSGDPSVDSGTSGLGGNTLGCSGRDSRGNTRVNQDCTF